MGQIYCFWVENTWMPRGELAKLADLEIKVGWGNGYVAVEPDHPWYGVHCEEIECDVHGGLTFGELQGGYWVVGFDTGHYMDTLENWPMERVIQETQALRVQALAAARVKRSWLYRAVIAFKRYIGFAKE
jgi:hypothetical protein